jgi:Zn-dependent protease/predicted transcriptional regulator
MKWSLRVGSLAGIGIYVHWTFLLLIGFLLFAYGREGVAAAVEGVGFVLAVFGCIVLHELGHALAARRFGVPTQDITLLPIGGVARLQRMPEHPLQELVVAIAGPLVNVVIAAALLVILFMSGGWNAIVPGAGMLEGGFLQRLMSVNVFLVGFNLLPAFPMDGGRVLRALLATRMDYTRATNIAASIGQAIAILFAIAGMFGQGGFMLLFIALFVYLGAEGEARLVQIRMLLRGVPVRDAMLRRFRTLSAHDSLQTAADELLAGSQQDFPVLDNDQLVGILRRQDLIEGLKANGREQPVSQVMTAECAVVEEYDMLERVMEQLREAGCSTIPVVRGGHMVGLVTLENVGEMMMIRSALQHADVSPKDLVEAA